MHAGFLLLDHVDGRSTRMRAVRGLLGGGGSAADAAGVGDDHAEHVVRAALLAEQQREIAAAGAAIGAKAHVVPADAALDGQFAGVTGSDIQRTLVGLVVAVTVVAKQPAAVPARTTTAVAAIAGGTEQRALTGGDRGLAGMLQGRDEIRLGGLLLIAGQQLSQGRHGDAGQCPKDGEHHDLLDQGRTLLPAMKADMLSHSHGVAPALPESKDALIHST